MRVLWISNTEITSNSKGSGSWIFAMANAFISVKGIVLGNIIPIKTKKVFRADFKSIQQWKIPLIKNVAKAKLNNNEKGYILDIVSVFKPDIIHIWGIENGYALITPFVKCPVLIEIQGINSEVAKFYHGGLSLNERFKLIGFKEVVTINPLCRQRQKMAVMINREAYIFNINKYFTTPTDWMRANIEARTKEAICFSNGFILRDEFYEAEEWKLIGDQIILTSASFVAPYKGIHVLLDALSILKVRFPRIKLHIIGPYTKRGLRTNGYVQYLLNKTQKLGLAHSVVWLGSLNPKEICKQIQHSSVFVNSSFMESAGLTILEAMAIGIPIVSSYTGGIPSLTSDSVLFFPPGDYKMCAFQISKALTDRSIILSSGKTSRPHIIKHHNKEVVVTKQLDIYKTILKENTIFTMQNATA
jgi:L-malate glycosyltransferase